MAADIMSSEAEDGKVTEITAVPSNPVEEARPVKVLSEDEYKLATLGYKQEFFRNLGLFENWAATFTSMNFVSGIPVLFYFVMYTGGPQAAFANWTMVGGFQFIVSLALAEIAAALPVAGGIYYWSCHLGGEKWGPFLGWMTAWWNWAGWVTIPAGVQQGSTNFLLSALEIQYPDATVLTKGWFAWILTSIGLFIAAAPNIYNPRVLQLYFRFAIVIFFTLLTMYWIWFPVKASGRFQTREGVFNNFYNGINLGDEMQASNGYCWVVSILFGSWVFYGFDASAHLAEETQYASETVAKGMWMSTLSAWVMSVPTLILILFCIQDFDGIIDATYTNNWAEYLVQLIGPNGAVAILSMLWIDSTCATASCFMSAQRVTYAISRDGVLPLSHYFRQLSPKGRMPVNAAYLVIAISIAITLPVIGSTVAFSAITATATIACNVSYIFPIVARHTTARKTFETAKWNLGGASVVVAVVATVWIAFQSVVLLLPQLYPVTSQTLNYAPIMIGGITIVSVIGWIFPFGLGGRHWFNGPQKTISEEELNAVTIVENEEGNVKA